MSTTSERLSQAYLAYTKLLRQLHVLIHEGRDESDEGEAIRDAVDEPWYGLTDFERQLARGLGTDLNYLGSEDPPRPETVSHQDFSARFEEVQADHDWAGALGVLREHSAFIARPQLSYLKGIFWARIEDFETALVFFEDSFRYQQPSLDYVVALVLTYLVLGRYGRACHRILEIDQLHPRLLPASVVEGANEFFEIEAGLNEIDRISADARIVRQREETQHFELLRQHFLELFRERHDGRIPFSTDESNTFDELIRFAA